MLRKVKRIFLRTFGILFSVIIVTGLLLFFGVQTYVFQNWLGHRAGDYLSRELNSRVYVDKVELDFFKRAKLKGLLLLDRHKDTLFFGDAEAEIKNFNYEQKQFLLNELRLQNVTSKIIRYEGDSAFNYSFLEKYFAGAGKDTNDMSGWNVSFGDVILENVNFNYRDEHSKTDSSKTINYNNIFVWHTSGVISGFKITGDTISAEVKNLSTTEQCGFVLKKLSGELKISNTGISCNSLNLKTPRSTIQGKLEFAYRSWDDFGDFLNKVELNSKLTDSTHIYFGDIAYFAEELAGLNKTLSISGTVKGLVSDLNLSDFKLAFGNSTRFSGNISLSGLPNISSSFLHFNARELSTSYEDIVSVPAYPFHLNKKITLPEELKKLGKISYRGKFDGFMNDFTTYGRFTTRLGKADTRLSIKLGEKPGDVAYDGKIGAENFSLGTLFGRKNLNGLSLNCSIKGKGVNISTVDAVLEGEVKSVMFNNYTYRNITLKGNIKDKLFSGVLNCKDPNANFDFNGTANFQNKIPEMDFISTINTLRLNQLNITNNSDSGSFSSQILINIKGDNMDNLSGQVNFDNTIYKTKTRSYKLSSLDLLMDQNGSDKKIKLSSGYVNGIIRGKYNLSTLAPSVEQILYHYYPAYFKKPLLVKNYGNDFVFRFTVKKFNAISELFFPDLMFSTGTNIDGNFISDEHKLNLQFTSSKCNYKNFVLHEALLILNQNDSTVLTELSTQSFNIGDSLSLVNFNTTLKSANKHSNYKIDWDNLKLPVTKGELQGRVQFENEQLKLYNDKLSVTVTDSVWNMTQPGTITLDKVNRLFFTPLTIVSRQQNISVAGTLSNNSGDSLVISSSNLLLEQFNPLLKLFQLKLNGILNGKINLTNPDGNFAFDGNLNLAKLSVNDNAIGELSANANYVTSENLIRLNGFTSLGLQDEMGNQVKNISFSGFYYLDRKEESIDIDFKASPANLRLLNPLLDGILTINNGFVNGQGKIHGTAANLKIDGKLRLFNSEVKVDYTNVTYNITGDIEIMPDQIRFSELLMRETGSRSAPQGTINGNIFHNNFKDIQLDYDVTYRNMLVLNTTVKENKLFYGRLYGTGNVGIYGFLNNLYMQVRDTTVKNSRLFLPLDGPAEVNEEDFVQFVKKDTAKTVAEKPLTGFNLDLAVYATPTTSVQIILDQQTGDVLNAQGQGDIKIYINTFGKFEMFGDYIITNGDYLFTLQNVINKKFDIDAGSSISWAGDPFNADINVSTSYKQRASVAPLLNDTTGQYKGRFPVECKLLINGKLFTPHISFLIDFPNIDATAKARINNILSDEVELNRQVFSFLLFRSFITPQIFNSTGGGVTAGNAAASTGSELLSNRVSEFLNTYFGNLTGLKDVQLGLNYRPGTQTSGDAVDLALSKQFFNNKVSVDGNFGVNGNQSGNSNNLIGDVNINYKLSDDGRYRLKGFNRTNDNTQVATAGGPYTQGIGFFYREEFETFNDLYTFYLKKLKRIGSTKN